MLATKPAELTLAIQKATEGFTVIVDKPTDNDLIEIRQLLVPVLMKTTYNELTLQHNIVGFIIPTERYEQIYKKGAYAVPPVILLYDDNIDKDATRLEINRAEGKPRSWTGDPEHVKYRSISLGPLAHAGLSLFVSKSFIICTALLSNQCVRGVVTGGTTSTWN